MNILTDYIPYCWDCNFRNARIVCFFLFFTSLTFLPVFVTPALHAQSFQSLGKPDITNSSIIHTLPYGVSEDGSAVAGTIMYRPAEGPLIWQAFRWDNGLFTLLGDFQSAEQVGSRGRDISGDGSLVVGWGYGHFTPPPQAGFVHDGIEIAEVDGSKEIHAISENGEVMVGRSVTKEYTVGDDTEVGFEAVRVEGGTIQGLGHLTWGNPDFDPDFESEAHGVSADGSIVVGESSVDIAIQEAFIWQNGSMVGLGMLQSPFRESKAYGVSDDGSVVVGMSVDTEGNEIAVRWENRQIKTLDQFEERGWARAVSGDGAIIVGESGPMGSITVGGVVYLDTEAFIWTQESGMRRLQDVLENDYGLNLTRWQQLLSARDISNDGSIVVGWGINADGEIEGWRAELSPLERALIVNRTGDEADHDLEDDVCDTMPVEVGNQCTLRAAIQTANARGGESTGLPSRSMEQDRTQLRWALRCQLLQSR